ncbi:unnamed protein product [Phytomonas sp. EM1]|nr:unnamed protein product [Phytomonas sp. EM1]|eukprot:CCW65503.1 unnamed protein product [Phytomonas sp. isolate EM1]
MFSGFPTITLAPPAPAINEAYEMKDPNGCVNTVSFAPVETIRLTYPALCHLLHLSKAASKNRAVFGRLCGLQLGTDVTITDARVNPTKKITPQDYETPEERRQRQEQERKESDEVFNALNKMFEEEMLDSYQVGCFVVSNSTYNPYSPVLLTQLVQLHKSGQPCVMLSYDPFRTALFGKPYLRGFTLTEAYLQYEQIMAVKGVLKARAVRESKLTSNGVVREIPVQIEVDPFHMLGLEHLILPPVQDSFLAIQSPVVGDYVEALVDSMSTNASALATGLDREQRLQGKEQGGASHGSLAQSPETLLALQHLREQAEHVEAICNSILMNASLLRDL